MFDLVSIGSISLDLFFVGSSLTFKDDRFQLAIGGKYLSDNFYLSVGGGGANVAIGGSKNGLKTAVLGFIGNNSFKRIILEKLKENNVSTRYCDYIDNYINISTILISPKGERSIIHYTTPHQHLISDRTELTGITKAKAVYLGNLPEVSLTERLIFLRFLKKKGVLTIANLGVKDCRRSSEQLKPFLNTVDILIINGHEFSEMSKVSYKQLDFKDNVINNYLPYLNDQLVVITEGNKGSFAYYKKKVFYQPAKVINKIIDTTGAGDAFSSGFISQYLKSTEIEASLAKGCFYASKIIQKIGAN